MKYDPSKVVLTIAGVEYRNVKSFRIPPHCPSCGKEQPASRFCNAKCKARWEKMQEEP